MLGRQNRQTSFIDIKTWCPDLSIKPDSIYGLLDAWGDKLIKDEDYADMYSSIGRSSVSPALLSKVLLLMYHDNVTDREAEERAMYDLRWKAALRLPLDEAGFDHSSICRFRIRLLINQQQKMVFERFVTLAKEAGIIKNGSTQIIDSSHILGAGAVKDTYMLIKTAIQKLLKIRAKQHKGKADVVELKLDYSQNGKPEINWDDKEAHQQLLQSLVEDSRALLATVKNNELTKEEQAAAELLATVTEQDIEISPEGKITLRNGVAKDRTISIEDPDMRHGHKTSSGKFNGHKAQIVADEASEIITNVAVTPGNEPDGGAIDNMLKDTSVKPGILMGDTAYGTLAGRDSAEENEVVMVAPLPVGNVDLSDDFCKYNFSIDWDTMTCTCPAGCTTIKTYTDKDGIVKAFVYSKNQCGNCPYREQCCAKGTRRTVNIHPEEQRRRQILEQTQTAEFKAMYRTRPKVERKVAHVMNHGMRKARYKGRKKTLIQLAFKAAVVNLKRIYQCTKGDVSKLASLTKAMDS